MALTIEEIKTAVEQQPELKDQVLPLVAGDKIIRTKEEDQQFLDRHVNAVVDEKVKTKLQAAVDNEFGQALSEIDQEIKTITGIEKQANEKTTAYAKRAIEEKHKGGDPVTKERVKQLEDMLKQSEEENKRKLEEYQQKLFTTEINHQLNGKLDKVNIALPVHLKTDEEKQAYINQQKALIRQGFLSTYQPKKDEAGNTVYYKGEQPMLSQKDGKPLGADDLVEVDYKPWFVPQTVQQGGTGTGSTAGAGSAGGSFKDKESIHKHLAANGLDALSKEYQQQFEKLATENNISI